MIFTTIYYGLLLVQLQLSTGYQELFKLTSMSEVPQELLLVKEHLICV